MQRGFTLIEVMVAAVILSIGCLGVLGMLLTVINNNRMAHDRTVAITLAEQQLVELEALATKWTGNANKESTNLLEKLAGADASKWYLLNASHTFSTGNTSGTSAAAFNVNGISPSSSDGKVPPGRFYIGFYVLPESSGSKSYNRNEYLRGAVRVSWNRKGAADSSCSDLSSFDSISTTNGQGLKNNCEFVTLPFAFKKTTTT